MLVQHMICSPPKRPMYAIGIDPGTVNLQVVLIELVNATDVVTAWDRVMQLYRLDDGVCALRSPKHGYLAALRGQRKLNLVQWANAHDTQLRRAVTGTSISREQLTRALDACFFADAEISAWLRRSSAVFIENQRHGQNDLLTFVEYTLLGRVLSARPGVHAAIVMSDAVKHYFYDTVFSELALEQVQRRRARSRGRARARARAEAAQAPATTGTYTLKKHCARALAERLLHHNPSVLVTAEEHCKLDDLGDAFLIAFYGACTWCAAETSV